MGGVVHLEIFSTTREREKQLPSGLVRFIFHVLSGDIINFENKTTDYLKPTKVLINKVRVIRKTGGS